MVMWIQTVCMCTGYLPWWLHGYLGAVAHYHCSASWEKIISHTVSLGKNKKLKQSMVSTECVLVLHHHKVEKLEVKPF